MAFAERKIDVSFSKGGGSNFTTSGNSTLNLTGLRVQAEIKKASNVSFCMAHLAIYGMPLSAMNDLSTLGIRYRTVEQATVTVTAGDDEAGMFKVFEGNITSAWFDGHAMPQVCFRVDASAGMAAAVKSVSPTSKEGSADVKELMQGFAQEMGLQFEGNQVSAKLASPYFWGSPRSKAIECAAAAGCQMLIDLGTLAIWTPDKPRSSAVPLISPQTGMIAYPSYTAQGILVNSLFNPNVVMGGEVEIKSDLEPACGNWAVHFIDYALASKIKNGPWFMSIGCFDKKSGGAPLGGFKLERRSIRRGRLRLWGIGGRLRTVRPLQTIQRL